MVKRPDTLAKIESIVVTRKNLADLDTVIGTVPPEPRGVWWLTNIVNPDLHNDS
jgi:hypothetical protein